MTGTRTPISHVVFVMMENHSFDNFFETYPAANGANNSQIETPVNLLNLANKPSLVQIPNGNYSTEDPNEGLDTYHADWDSGKMDGFAQYSGAQAMTYFTSAQAAIEWDWAEEVLPRRHGTSQAYSAIPFQTVSCPWRDRRPLPATMDLRRTYL